MEGMTDSNNTWQREDAQVFWGEIAPSDHVVQIYEDDQAFIDLLAGYVVGGFCAGDSVVIISTPSHIGALNERIRTSGFDPFDLKIRGRYFPLDAEETLTQFMVKGWPDATLFNHVISDVLLKAKRNGRQVRAFGEMVAILWAQGHTGATVQLEHLWNKFCATESFCLFCAYPKSGFTEDPQESMTKICCTHSKVITGVSKDNNDILYTSIDQKRSMA
jgi:hypothetical protein